MKKIAIISTCVLLALVGHSYAPSSQEVSESSQEKAFSGNKKVFIHLTDNFKENDGPVCVAFNAAWQALRDGSQVEIFFDQEAAFGVKQWEPGKTDLGLYPLPDRIKPLLTASFGMKKEALPANYQEYLTMLHEKGARVTVNGFWNALTSIEETIKGRKNILSYAEPLTLKEFLSHREEAEVYLKF